MSQLTISTQEKRFPVAPDLYGLFFEDISHAGDGGLYPEMLRNRSFELNLAIRLYLLAYSNDFLHDFIKPYIICIDRKLLHHKTYRCIIYTINFFDCIFHFCCTVCAIKVYHFKFFLHLFFLLKKQGLVSYHITASV